MHEGKKAGRTLLRGHATTVHENPGRTRRDISKERSGHYDRFAMAVVTVLPDRLFCLHGDKAFLNTSQKQRHSQMATVRVAVVTVVAVFREVLRGMELSGATGCSQHHT